jgi:hypothetical protein
MHSTKQSRAATGAGAKRRSLGLTAGAMVLAAAFAISGGAAQAAVINISGTQNGEQSGNGACSDPCANGALINPVQVTFAPGTYTLKDAYSPTTGLAAGALYDAWNFEAGNGTGWVWNYTALFDDGTDGATISPANYQAHILFNVNAPVADRRSTEQEAAAFGAATAPQTFTVDKTTTIDFVANDYYLADNAGGVSLTYDTVSAAAVPEPSTWALMTLGVLALGAALRSARQDERGRLTTPRNRLG